MPVIALRPAVSEDLAAFAAMEADADTAGYIIPYPLQRHREEFARPEILYLAIHTEDALLGFILLALDLDGTSVECRRIVVAAKGAGTGQAALAALEGYCLKTLGRKRLWLDVFEHNQRARHVYEKLGYTLCGRDQYEGKTLLLYEKRLDIRPP